MMSGKKYNRALGGVWKEIRAGKILMGIFSHVRMTKLKTEQFNMNLWNPILIFQCLVINQFITSNKVFSLLALKRKNMPLL